MIGIRRDGQAVEHTPRKPKPAPTGPLMAHQVRDLQAIITRGLLSQGYSKGQVAQILNSSLRTAFRRIADANLAAQLSGRV